MSSPLLQFDRDLVRENGCRCIIGADEAGRGALAGPVVSAAIMLPESFYRSSWCRRCSPEINDSKQLSPSRRDSVYREVLRLQNDSDLAFSVGVSSVQEIESLNVLGATRLSFQRAIEGIQKTTAFSIVDPDSDQARFSDRDFKIRSATDAVDSLILIDGLPLRPFPYGHRALVKGDARSLAIALASIIAKVTRDRIMRELDHHLPAYGFARNKGYGTQAHRRAIVANGPAYAHRPTFLRKLLSQAIQTEWFL